MTDFPVGVQLVEDRGTKRVYRCTHAQLEKCPGTTYRCPACAHMFKPPCQFADVLFVEEIKE